jgi:RNA-binding protein YlmH
MALGLGREKFGDLLLEEGRCQVYVVEELAAYVTARITQIRRSPAHFQEVPLSRAFPRGNEGQVRRITVASPRLDAVLAAGFHLARQKAQAAIDGGHVKHNHFITTDRKMTLAEGDLLSLRRHGRLKIESIEGTTRKDRRVIVVRLMKR